MSDFSGNSAKLAIDSIRNAYFRQQYVKATKHLAEEISRDALNAESLSPCQQKDVWLGAAQKAASLRNTWIYQTRRHLSPSALAFSIMLKAKAPGFKELFARYYKRLHAHSEGKEGNDGHPSHDLDIYVYKEIVRSSGRTNTTINRLSKVTGLMGILFLLFNLTFIWYGAMKSDDPTWYFANCLVTFQASFAGAYVGSLAAWRISNNCRQRPATSFLCSVILVVVYGCAGAVLGNVTVTLIRMTVFHQADPNLTILFWWQNKNTYIICAVDVDFIKGR